MCVYEYTAKQQLTKTLADEEIIVFTEYVYIAQWAKCSIQMEKIFGYMLCVLTVEHIPCNK